jgi:membrane protein
MSRIFLFALNFIRRDIWLMDTARLTSTKRKLIFVLRRLYLSVRQYKEVNCSIWAYSLTTVTLISLIPILAFSFSILKGFGGHKSIHSQFIEPSLDRWLGERDAPELRNLADQIVRFVEDTDLSSLGVAGLVVVLFAVIRLLGSVESVFNALWHIQSSRSLIRKLTDYLGVVVTIPLVLFISVPTLTSLQLMQVNEYPVLSQWGFSFLIFAVVWFGFTLMYQIMPNAQIRIRSSMNGGFLGALLWIFVYYSHIKLQVGVASYNALYAGFSAVPIFIGWVYFSWSSVLIGAAFAASIQIEEEHKNTVIRKNLDFLRREELALTLSLELADSFCSNKGSVSIQDLAEKMDEEEAALSVVLHDLQRNGIVEKTEADCYLLSRYPENIDSFIILESMKEKIRDLDKDVSMKTEMETTAFQKSLETQELQKINSIFIRSFAQDQIQSYQIQSRQTTANYSLKDLLLEYKKQKREVHNNIEMAKNQIEEAQLENNELSKKNNDVEIFEQENPNLSQTQEPESMLAIQTNK